MEKVVYKGLIRTKKGSRVSCRERAEGQVPAILYGRENNQEPVSFSLAVRDVDTIIRTHARLLEVEFDDGGKETGLIREIQLNPVTDQVLHLDLIHIDLTKKIEIEVEIDFVGHPKGLAAGGKFTHDLSDLPITCLATDIPEKIAVRVGHLEIDDNLTVADLDLPAGVECTVPEDTVLCHVKAFLETVEEEGDEEGGDGSAEPEVITRKDDPEEEK